MPYGKKTCPGGGRTCPLIISTQLSYCEKHQAEYEAARGSSYDRGYGPAHKKLRKEWAPIVALGKVACSRCHEPIEPGTPWDLGHHDTDRTKYTGPEHEKCNRGTNGRKVSNDPPPF